jgi:hypothetical protein
MSPMDIISRWETRLIEWRQFNSQVDGAKVCEEVLEDFRAWQDAEENQLLSLKAAAEISGYTPGHLGRLVRNGEIPNAGRPNAPKIHRRHVPIKPGHLPAALSTSELAGTSKRQVVRSIVGREKEATR